jgi:hypothetical protein
MRISVDWVVEIISLIDNIYPTTVKAKMTVSIDDPAVKEVVDLGDNEAIQKTKLNMDEEGREEFSDRGSKGVVDVAKRDVVGGRQEAGAGTKYKGGDAKESGLKLVGGGDERSMVGGPLKSDDSQEVQGCVEKFILGNKI